MSSSPCRSAAFTLVEVMMAMLIVTLFVSALAIPLANQVQARRLDAVRRQLEASGEALMGFAAAHGRLPCPAIETSRGEEAFAPGGDAGNGECARFHGGFLPAAALGLPGLDDQGLARDPWDMEGNRIRYAVAGNTVNGVTRPLTRRNGARQATLQGLADANRLLVVCSSGEGATAAGCAFPELQLTRKAAFVLVSTGPNGGAGARNDEARNLDGATVFVSREFAAEGTPRGPFDDIVHWGGLPLLAHRLLAAGQVP